ncbi:MAG: metal-dependent transcriptional regulator [Candidatus Korarchaeota archaeon]
MELTKKERMYLTKIYELIVENGNVIIGITEIAKYFSVSKPTALAILTSLCRKGLVQRIPRKGYILSKGGIEKAKELVHAYRVLEVLLYRTIEENLDEISEMILSVEPDDLVIEKLCCKLGYPCKCPHEKEIPHIHGGESV